MACGSWKLPVRGLAAAIWLSVILPGQARRALTHQDYDSWRTINSSQLSADGRYLAYAWMPYDADGEVVVRELASGKETRHPVGTLPPPPVVNMAELEPGQEPPRSTIRLAFTGDGKWLVAGTYPEKAAMEAARKARKRPEEMPKPGLLCVEVATGRAIRADRVKNFQVPAKGGPWVAYLLEAPVPERSAEASKPPAGDEMDQEETGAAAPAGRSRTEYGTELVLKHLGAPDAPERRFASVASYSFARDGAALVYAVSSRKPDENGVYQVKPGDTAAPAALLAGKGKYQKLTWDRLQAQLAFFSDKDDAESKTPRQKVYYWDRKAASAAELLSDQTPGLGDGLVISDKGNLSFSRDGKRLVVPTAPPPKPAPEAATGDRVLLDLWHWRDPQVQTIQKVRANQERNRTYAAVFHLDERKLVQVGEARLASVTFSDDGLRAAGSDERNYRSLTDYDGTYADLYTVDTITGARKMLWRKLRSHGRGASGTALSPAGDYLLVYQDKHWFSIRLRDGATRNLTGPLGVAFHQEDDDTPDPADPYGALGWTTDGRAVVYDRYDVWVLAPDGSRAANVTAGDGRKRKIVFRAQRMLRPNEEEEDATRHWDPSQPLTLRGVSEETRASGFFQTAWTGGAPAELLWGDANYQVAGQAREAQVVLLTASRFDQFPDLHVTDLAFRAPRRVTQGEEQRQAFLWGKAETIAFQSADGIPLKATLIKPGNFDPSRKYPLMVYIYEKLSQNKHNFQNPTPGTSVNFSYYASNSYVILQPDIVYREGQPGQSALRCVLPAVQKVVDLGFIDEKAIGIQGHSWGGYQISYMLTQTNRFRAAEAGAPVGNMTSAYSGIRWGSGLPRQFQYEQTQSRIGASLFDAPQKYIENSPVFHIRNVQTPVLILHNDQDDAVPWYQGIELFLALRRNGKEAYLLNYNGEYHGLRRRHNQRDFSVRMQQFFDHYLKGAPKPEWMEKGVPFLEREEEKERLVTAPTN